MHITLEKTHPLALSIEQGVKMDPVKCLPQEIALIILSYLNMQDLAKSSLVSLHWRALSGLVNKTSLLSSLIPRSVVEGLLTEKEDDNLGESAMCAVALLIVNIILGTIKVRKANNFKSLDANPGDKGCQSRALVLRKLTRMDLEAEYATLNKNAQEIKKLVNTRKSSPKEQQKCPPHKFFCNHFEALTISKEIEYLLHCYLSTILRKPYQTLSNGVVMTKSDTGQLKVLSEKITILDISMRRKIVEENQKTLSVLSVAAMRIAAAEVSTLGPEEKNLMMTMLSPEHTHLFTPNFELYEPKAFVCQFYGVKTLLIRLREEHALVCLKSIVVTGKASYLLLQSSVSGEEFELLPDETYTVLSQMTAVVVFEAVVNVEKEKAKKLLIEQGFTTIMLSEAAIAEPYEPKSSLDDVKVPEAVAEITCYTEKRAEWGDAIALDHIYLSTLGAEINKGGDKY